MYLFKVLLMKCSNQVQNSLVVSISTMSCPIKVNSDTIELTANTSCYCILDLLCVNCPKLLSKKLSLENSNFHQNIMT